MENKKKAFIHISDLHIVTDKLPGCTPNSNYEKFWLQVNGENTDSYVQHFCDCVQKEFNNHEFYLIVSGDIADKAEQSEYVCAQHIFNTIKTKLDIDNNKILIVPGNHDVHRRSCENEAEKEENATKNAWELHNAKFGNYSSFYKEIKTVGFDAEKAISDKMDIEDKQLLFIGINSNYKLGFVDGMGAVNIADLNSQLNIIKSQNPKSTLIAVFHHNLNNQDVEDTSHFGSFERESYHDFIESLSDNGIVCALFGNEHIKSHASSHNITFSNSGIFARKSGSSTFKIYELNDKNAELYFEEYLYECKDGNDKDNRVFGTWIKQGDSQKITLRNSTNIPLNDANINTPQPIDSMPSNIKSNAVNDNPKEKNDEELSFQNYLVNIIKRKNIFHQGHFHWGENSRSLNWIDLTSIFKDREATKSIQAELVKFIEKEQIKYEAVIGIGMDGNILAAPFITKEIPYSYLPYSYRYDKSHEVEQNPNFASNVQSVLIITDVVHSGNSIMELIVEKAKDSFDNIKEIHVVSLLYTGRRDGDVFGSEKRIKFHPMAAIEIAQCPYEDVSQCPNYKNKFCDIFELDPKDDTNKSDLGNASKN